MNIFEKLQKIDARIIYLVVFAAIAVPMLKPIGLPVTVTAETRQAFEYIEKLPPNSVVWLGGDYDMSSAPELTPAGQAIARQLFKNGHKIILYSMWETGAMLNNAWLGNIAKEFNKEYGVDWVDLGWKPMAATVLRNMTQGIVAAASDSDIQGRPISTMPLIQRVPQLTRPYVELVVDLTTGRPGDEDYRATVSPDADKEKGVPMVVVCTGISGPGKLPYVRSGQYKGLVVGMGGAAEYESLVGRLGDGTAGMDSQAAVHALIIVFIILGNVGYVLSKKK